MILQVCFIILYIDFVEYGLALDLWEVGLC
jgi:hypothetical protein